MAYFTDPMGDEFKKAIEEAMEKIEADESNKEKSKDSKRHEKSKMKRLSTKTKRALK